MSGRKKSEVGSPKSEVEKKSEVGSLKSEVKPKLEKENNSAFNIPQSEIKELPTANSKLPTENTMEVHHHPEVEKKGLKENVLEGLMIFLAVTMGFFAETIRENISDNAKGREYIRSFVEDLRRDTTVFSYLIGFDGKKVAVLNTMSPCFDTIANGRRSSSCLVPLVKISAFNHNLNFSDGTMQQLKNAGGFRLLNKSDKDSIVAYDHVVRNYLNFESTLFQERQDIVRNVFDKLLNFKADVEMFPDSGRSDVKTPLLFSTDKALLNECFNDLLLYKRVNISQIRMVNNLKKQATSLIKYFDNKYDL